MDFVLIAVCGYLLAVLLLMLRERHWLLHYLAHSCALGASALLLAGAIRQLQQGQPGPELLLGPCSLRLDSWSAAFLLFVGLAAFFTNLYSMEADRQPCAAHCSVAALRNLLPAAMVLLLVAGDAFSLLLFGEICEMIFFLLLQRSEAGQLSWHDCCRYLVWVHLGAALLMLALLLLSAAAGSLSFTAMAAHAPAGALRQLVFLTALLSCVLKIGLLPVQRRLLAAASDAQLAALLHGVLLNMALYVFGRLCFFFLPVLPYWWGAAVLLAGAVLACLSVMHAGVADDLREILSWLALGNTGLVFLAFGCGLLLAALTTGGAWALPAFLAALLLTANQALCHTQLALAVGSLRRAAAGERFSALGGLAHAMPLTACATFIGTLGVAALPLTGSFAGLWLLLQSFVILAHVGVRQDARLWAALAMLLLGLALMLLAGCCLRLLGGAFLGRPRSEGAAQATETRGCAVAALLGGAVAMVLTGLCPSVFVTLFAQALPAVDRQTAVGLNGFLENGSLTAAAPLLLALTIAGLSLVLWRGALDKHTYLRQHFGDNVGTATPAVPQSAAPAFYLPVCAQCIGWLQHCLGSCNWQANAVSAKELFHSLRARLSSLLRRCRATPVAPGQPAGVTGGQQPLAAKLARNLQRCARQYLQLAEAFPGYLEQHGARLYLAGALAALLGVLLAGAVYQ